MNPADFTSLLTPLLRTLPSNLTAAAQRYAPSTVPTPGSGSPPDTQIPIPNSTQNTMTPAMRQVLASAANSGRGRSGSLTLASPSSGLQNAFGPGILSWQASPLSQQQRGHEITPTISNDSIGNDDRSTGVLDYLGLADSSAPGKRSAYVPATLSELRAQAQQQIQISRSRASTISNPYRNRGPLPVSFMAPGSMRGGEEIEIGGQGLDGENPAAYEALGYPNGLPNGQLPNPLKNSMHLLPGSPANRPRATSVGTLLESPTTRHPPTFAASQYDSPSVSPPQQGLVDPSLDPTIAEYSSFSQTLASAPPQKRPTPAQHHSDIDLSHLHHSIQASNFRPSVHSTTNTPRARTPEDPTYSSRGGPYMAGGDVGMGGGGGGGGGNQVPTRSLWLGNLDPEITTQELMHIFHAYGAIESLRLLPDKEVCLSLFSLLRRTTSMILMASSSTRTPVRLRQLCREERRHPSHGGRPEPPRRPHLSDRRRSSRPSGLWQDRQRPSRPERLDVERSERGDGFLRWTGRGIADVADESALGWLHPEHDNAFEAVVSLCAVWTD
jgi:protein JSN1